MKSLLPYWSPVAFYHERPDGQANRTQCGIQAGVTLPRSAAAPK